MRGLCESIRRVAPSFTALVAFAAAALAAVTCASAQPLNTSGKLPIPNPNPGAPSIVAPSYTHTATNFTGTWSAPAATPWRGTFKGTTATGTFDPPNSIIFNFTDATMFPNGHLPSGSYFILGDVDSGSVGFEIVDVQAYDLGHMPIPQPWLDRPSNVWGIGTNGVDMPTSADMPEYMYTASTAAYHFDGFNTGPFNSTLSIAMLTNTRIAFLEVQTLGTNFTFSIAAPIPEPASAASAGLLLITAVITKRRRTR